MRPHLHLRKLLRLPGVGRPGEPSNREVGSRPGIEHAEGVNEVPPAGEIQLRCIDYGPERVADRSFEDIDALIAEPRPDGTAVRWINIDGLHPYVVNQIKAEMGVHTLAAEDVLHVPQRPKCEWHGDHLFATARMLDEADGQLTAEQVSFFVFEDTLITFQERPGDVWSPLRKRLAIDTSRLRRNKADFLFYALLDAIVDQCFPILEDFGETLSDLELAVFENPSPENLRSIHTVKNRLLLLRRVIWPTREMIDRLCRNEHGFFGDFTLPFMRDVYDHAIQVMDVVETYRELAGGLVDLHMSATSNRMNEVMQVLTIMASFFIPATFIAGVYGMNFEHIPELKWKHGYLYFWLATAMVLLVMAIFFIRRGWIGRGRGPG